MNHHVLNAASLVFYFVVSAMTMVFVIRDVLRERREKIRYWSRVTEELSKQAARWELENRRSTHSTHRSAA